MFRLNGKEIELKEFPDGTPALQIGVEERNAVIEWLYEKNEEILLYYIVNHLRAYGRVDTLRLIMPYIPNARLDRVDAGDNTTVFTLKYFCNFINSLKFDSVTVRDPHSYVSVGMLDNVIQEEVTPVIKELADVLSADRDKPFILFFPDEGAHKRYSKELAEYTSSYGSKTRTNGRVENLELRGDLPQGKFDALIVDDISSYGNTFLRAAQALKDAGADKVYLYVTHCENNILKGKIPSSGLFTRIYTTESIYTGDHELIQVIGGKHNA